MAEFSKDISNNMNTSDITLSNNQKSAVDLPVIKPVIIGNPNGPKLLMSMVINPHETSQSSVNSVSVVNGSFFNLPLVIQQPLTYSKISKVSSVTVPTKPIMSSASNYSEDIYNFDVNQLQNKSADESVVEKPDMTLESELYCKVPLSSSDTVILSTASMSTANTLPISSLSITSYDKVLTKDMPVSSCLSLKRPFSLLSNISDRSVSLESIPSLGLFQPDHNSFSSTSLYNCELAEAVPGSKTSALDLAVSDNTSSQLDLAVSDGTSTQVFNEITVVGNNVPKSVIFLMKKQPNEKSPCDKQMLIFSEQNECERLLLNTIPSTVINIQNDHSNVSPTRQTSKDMEVVNSDTDTELQHKEVGLANHKKRDITRSDTVILNATQDHSVVGPSAQLCTSDTIILPCEEKDLQSEEKLSEGFSFASTSSLFPPSLTLLLSEPSIDKPVSLEVQNISLSSLPSNLLPVPALQNGNFKKSFYIVTNDGHLAAVTLGDAQLNQLGFLNAEDIPLSVQKNSLGFSSKNVDVKETQTELVFGTNSLCFKLVDAVHDENNYVTGQFRNTALEKSLPLPHLSVLQSADVVNNNDTTQDQPQSLLENIQGTLPLAKDAENNNASSENVGPKSKDNFGNIPLKNCGRIPSLTLGNDCPLFTCKECQEKFKTKQDFVYHGKMHRKEFKCELCNATFNRIGNFNRHMKIHNLQPEGRNAFKCNDCGREFLQRCDLKRHLLIHAKQEPHRCEQCGKGYIRRSDLVVHMRFHNKDKAFKCSLCDKSFFQTGDLSRHIRHAHKPNSQLTCGHCNRKYACESTLIRHMKVAHKDIILSSQSEASRARVSANI